MKRILLLAGETSGDMHGAILARALLRRRPDLELWGVGGERMEEAGVRLFLRSEDLAVIGLLEVVSRAGRLLRALTRARRALEELRPHLFVPIDYPDFNFRLLPVATRLKIPTAYYISPQVWAWRPGRIAQLKRHVRRMIVIFPFEARLYENASVPVTWVGHPLIDVIAPAESPEVERVKRGLPAEPAAVALLPGSRASEVRRIGPLLSATRRWVAERRAAEGMVPVRFALGRAPGLEEEVLRAAGLLTGSANPPARGDAAGGRPTAADPDRIDGLSGVDALRCAELGLVASGTATLEATLLGRPVMVVYRMNPVTYALARRMVKVEHIAMANLLAGRRLVPEYVQDAARPEVLGAQVQRLLLDPEARETLRAGLLEARRTLGPPGAADRAAQAVLEVLEGS
jgi:lipid-A-disaccharide synthase